nr:MAG TPA: hypothetical protein [Caudoviricetes sp.]
MSNHSKLPRRRRNVMIVENQKSRKTKLNSRKLKLNHLER